MNLPRINQKMWLRVTSGPWKGHYPTYVEGIDPHGITVAVPMFGGSYVPVGVDDVVSLDFLEGGERLGFQAQVLQRIEGSVPLLILSQPSPGSVMRQQLRDFVRLDITLPVSYAIVPNERPTVKLEQQPKEPKRFLMGRTIDLSGGGAQMITGEPHPIGTKLELILELDETTLQINAEVVRKADHPGTREVCLGVHFIDLCDRDRERIVRFIFQEQRERRRKGLL